MITFTGRGVADLSAGSAVVPAARQRLAPPPSCGGTPRLSRLGPVLAAHPDVRCPEPGGVGGQIIRLVLGFPLGGDAEAIVLYLARYVGRTPAQHGATKAATWAAACTPRSQVSMEIRVRRAKMSSRCRAPSWDAAYTASTAR